MVSMKHLSGPLVVVTLTCILTLGLQVGSTASVRSSVPGMTESRQSLITGCAATGFYSGNNISFKYSPCWMPSTYTEESSFSWLVVVLSDQSTHSPCRTVTNSTGSTTSCGWPIGKLQRSHAVVEWFGMGRPDWKLSDQRGRPLNVGGRPAREEILHHGCPQIGGDEMVSVEIARPVANNFFQVTACLRSPNIAVQLGRLNAMLQSVKWTGS
jgi:hypothetical protein